MNDDQPNLKKNEDFGPLNVDVEKISDNSTPWKGKPASFFVMTEKDGPLTDPANPKNFELNDE